MPDYLKISEEPPVPIKHLITAFKGWPDAGEGASSAIRYFLRKLPARRFAELDPEEFYDFTQVRPQTSMNSEGQRVMKWPANELYYWISEDRSRGLMFLLGLEPNLRWKTYCRALLEPAQGWGVETVVHLGSLLDAIPHTREVRVSGSSTNGDLRATLEGGAINASNYQGPTGITSAVMESCNARGLHFATMWGHTPHYLHAAPNYRVSYALASNLCRLLEIPVSLDELRAAADIFDREVDKAVGDDSQIGAYVGKLEQRFDEAHVPSGGEMPRPEELVRDLEEFLKKQRGGEGRGDT